MSKNSDHILLKEITRIQVSLSAIEQCLTHCNNSIRIIINNSDIGENELDDLFLDERIDVFGSVPALKAEFAVNNLNDLSFTLLRISEKLIIKKP